MKLLAAKSKAEWVVDLWNWLLKDAAEAWSLQEFREMSANEKPYQV